MLHAEHIVVTHPISGKVLDLKAPLPADFEAQLAQLRKLTRSEEKRRLIAAEPVKRKGKPSPPPAHVREE
jgi:23S rRNA pseudouridine1911/1915/1917 synthase